MELCYLLSVCLDAEQVNHDGSLLEQSVDMRSL